MRMRSNIQRWNEDMYALLAVSVEVDYIDYIANGSVIVGGV